MEIMRHFLLGILFLLSTFLVNADDPMSLPTCDYPALYNFGDSNSDTGGIAAIFYPPGPPSGETYFGKPSGRASDGRLIIDFIADHLGLPFLSPYLDSLGANFQHGANFATGGAAIMRPSESWFENGVSPFNLEIQVEHYTQLKERTTDFYKENEKTIWENLPRPVDIPKALFTVDIGQNDIVAGQRKLSFDQQIAALPDIISEYSIQIRNLYQRGARTFWIHNTGPIGCLPITAVKVQNPAPGYLDEYGCVQDQNNVAMEFNRLLKLEVQKLRTDLFDASIVHVDMYAAKYELITQAKYQGFQDSFTICCGYHGIGYDVYCGTSGTVNGTTVYAGSCEDPSRVISWDGVHYTEAANSWVATRIMNGSYSDPPVEITKACHKQM